MKKIFTICMLLVSVIMSTKAQLQLIDSNGNVLKDNSSVTFTDPDAEFLEFGIYQIPMKIRLKNAGNKAVECKAKFEVTEIDSDKGRFACCAFGDCVQFNKTGNLEKGPVKIEAGDINSTLSQTEWTPTDKTTEGKVKYRLTVYDINNNENSVSLTVTLENKVESNSQGKTMSFDFKYYEDGARAVTDLRFNTDKRQNQYFAIFVPGYFAGKQITTIKFQLVTTSGVSNVKAWASKNLPVNSEAADMCQDVENPSENNTVTLNTPFTIPKEGCYIGYSFYSQGGTTSSCMYWYNYPAKTAGANFRSAENSGWTDYSADGYCLSLVATIAGEYAENDVVMDNSYHEIAVLKGDLAETELKITNTGTSAVKSLEYNVTDAITGETYTATVNTNNISSWGKSSYLKFNLGPTNVYGKTRRTVTITKINGENIEASDHTMSLGTVKVLTHFYPRKIVVEEGTGTWCGYCPRGIVGLEKMNKEFPDNFIGIAVHNGDEMDGAVNYYEVLYNFSGFPGCIANRQEKYNTDPNEYTLRQIVSAEKDRGEAKIEAQAFWKDDSKNEVSVTTTSRFAYPSNSINVNIAYAVVEDGVGPYMQANYYSGSNDLEGWGSKGSYVSTVFNDVARGIYDYNGVAGSVPDEIKANEDYTYEYTFALPANVANKNNISIVAMLINSDNGEILNADKVKPQIGTGVSPIMDKGEINIYVRNGSIVTDIDGCVLKVFNTAGREVANEALISGVYIVKAVIDGRNMVRKIVVR